MKTQKHKSIIHIDMDAFYASVEVLDNPALQGKPVVVGGSVKRGVVSAASYEARRFGVHSAQPIATAMQLCPHGIFLPVRMERYRQVSRQVFNIFYRFTPLVEALSIDEAFLDVANSKRLFGGPHEIAVTIKKSIFAETGLTASAGVGPSKFIAKIASDMHKPDGLVDVPYNEVEIFLNPLPIEKLWGVGKATQKDLSLLGINTIGDLRRMPPELLKKKFGKHGLHLHLLSQGIDDRDVVPAKTMKSISKEETFEKDILDMEIIKKELFDLALKVARRLRKHRAQGKTITLKIKYKDFIQTTRSLTLPEAVDDGAAIYKTCRELLKKIQPGTKPVRLLGISVLLENSSNENRQQSIFDHDVVNPRRRNLNRVIDRIQDTYGEDKIIPASLLKKQS